MYINTYNMNNRIATTVKIDASLYDNFKVLGVRHKITLQKLVERTVYRYVNEEPFRDSINNFVLPVTSGTIFDASASLA